MKNREKINQMSNEEMAEILSNSNNGEVCNYCSYRYEECDELNCYAGTLNWLNAESENTDESFENFQKCLEIIKKASEVENKNEYRRIKK